MVQAALIAAMYVVLTWLANIFGLANGAIQVRFSEALTILPYFTPAAIPGLFVGCVISNTITGAAVWDILFGSLATLIGAFFTYKLRHISKWLAPLPPILANILVVPQVLRIVYGAPDSIWYLTATVGIGEVISCGILGMILLFALQKSQSDFSIIITKATLIKWVRLFFITSFLLIHLCKDILRIAELTAGLNILSCINHFLNV